MRVFSFVKRRGFVLLIGLLLVALFIWFAGPYFAFAAYRPLEPEFNRLVAIALVVVCWAISALLRWLRARRASQQLAGAVLRQSQPEKDRPSAEAAKLRERFEEAVSTLTRGGRAGRSLYELPWYVFIGAPGSGKTTALINSGLKFPLEQRVGKAAVRGVGGTRNCDWWFTDEAVFLDTAGRYTTQDSDATADSEGWREFLALLGKYRKRRPVNGIVLTISAQDLMTLGEAEREAHVEAARRRLTEFSRELRIQLPVYVMVTKCDMVAGFTDYFDDLTQEDRAQVWGVTFPYEQTVSEEAPRAFPAEFDALMVRLNGRVFARLDAERGARRRATVFAFPQQMAGLREPLTQFVADVFSSTHFDRRVLLRGVYFTSGTQDGTQIDRLLGAIGRRFGIARESVAPPAGRGKAYFVERMLKDVVIAESGLAGVNRRLELQKAGWQLGAYVGIALVAVIAFVLLSVSYERNRSYLGQVAADVESLRQVSSPPVGVSVEGLLPRLNAVRAVAESANRYQGDAAWGMRWGLFQGSSVGNAARDAYRRELDSLLLPQFVARLRQHLIDYAAEPEKLYVYLKAYLMLGYPQHLDKKHLQFLADLEWKPPAPAPGPGVSLAGHVQSLLENGETLRPTSLDQSLVAQARGTIRRASIPQLMYNQIQRSYSTDPRSLHLDQIAGVGVEKVLSRKSGRKLSEPLPSLYTRDVFREVTTTTMYPLVQQFAEDGWVWGEGGVASASLVKLPAQVTDLYERDYNQAWDALLADLEIVPFSTVAQYRDALAILVGPTSPLVGILKAVVTNTSFVQATPGAAPPSLPTRITEGAKDLLKSAQKAIGTSSVTPGTVITQHFEPIHKLMAGPPAQIDPVLEQVRKIKDRLLAQGPEAGLASPLSALTDPTLLELQRNLREQAASLPSPVNGLIAQIAQIVGASVSFDATTELEKRYREEVVTPCQVRVEGHYPFADGNEMSVSDFGEVFGYGGVFEKFFADRLAKLVDTLQQPWAWRPNSVESSPAMLAQFQSAERIRQMFFDKDSKAPKVEFTVRLSNLDPAAQRFYVNIDDQQFQVFPGQETVRDAVWPGQGKGQAQATFEDLVGPPVTPFQSGGPWALFRLIDAAVQTRRQTGVFNYQTEQQHRAQLVITAKNAGRNPLIALEWRQFKCGS